MKKSITNLSIIFTLMLLSLASTINTTPTKSKIGAGIILGTPSGITGKYWLSNNDALELGFGAEPIGNFKALLHFNYTYIVIDFSNGNLPIYVGGGLQFLMGSSKVGGGPFGLALRPAIGAAYIFAEDCLEIFLDFVPVAILFVPGFDTGWGSTTGIRLKGHYNYPLFYKKDH